MRVVLHQAGRTKVNVHSAARHWKRSYRSRPGAGHWGNSIDRKKLFSEQNRRSSNQCMSLAGDLPRVQAYTSSKLWRATYTVVLSAERDASASAAKLAAFSNACSDSTLLKLDCLDASETYLADEPELRRAVEVERGQRATTLESYYTKHWEWSGAKHLHVAEGPEFSTQRDGLPCAHAASLPADWQVQPPRKLFEDDEFIAYSKPAGVLSSTVLYMAMMSESPEHRQSAQAWRLANRLDRDTSGILLFGKTPLANQVWNALTTRRSGSLEKLYIANLHQVQWKHMQHDDQMPPMFQVGCVLRVISGHGTTRRGLHRLYPLECVGQRLHDRMRRPVRIAETWFRIENRTPLKSENSLVGDLEAHPAMLYRVLCAPVTGRTHQIRLHAHALGMPVYGDVRYGSLSDLQGTNRHHLHAVALAFTTSEGRKIYIEAESPAWLDFSGEVEHP
jgi:23S rRNA-/tRNA-specific pseudouridylate synthase